MEVIPSLKGGSGTVTLRRASTSLVIVEVALLSGRDASQRLLSRSNVHSISLRACPMSLAQAFSVGLLPYAAMVTSHLLAMPPSSPWQRSIALEFRTQLDMYEWVRGLLLWK